MTFFNRTYHAFIKSHMSRIGVWPELPKYVRIIVTLIISFGVLTVIAPQLIRLHDVWGDGESVVAIMPILLSAIIIFTAAFNCMVQTAEIKVMLEEMEWHWKMIKNTSAVIVLDKYAERGCYLTKLYAIYINIALALYFVVLMSPVILDFVNPLNDTRPKFYFYEAEYGVDPDEYYWFILAHGYIGAVMGVNMAVTTETIYILLVEHACALFEVVGFANRIENFYFVSWIVVMGITVILISVTGIQILINIENLHMLLRITNFTFGQIFHLYLNSVIGQHLIDSSLKIHTFVCNLDWYDMSAKAQRLLIPIVIRSNKPCLLTAGKVYILSMQSFGMTLRTAGSYFMILAQLL